MLAPFAMEQLASLHSERARVASACSDVAIQLKDFLASVSPLVEKTAAARPAALSSYRKQIRACIDELDAHKKDCGLVKRRRAHSEKLAAADLPNLLTQFVASVKKLIQNEFITKKAELRATTDDLFESFRSRVNSVAEGGAEQADYSVHLASTAACARSLASAADKERGYLETSSEWLSTLTAATGAAEQLLRASLQVADASKDRWTSMTSRDEVLKHFEHFPELLSCDPFIGRLSSLCGLPVEVELASGKALKKVHITSDNIEEFRKMRETTPYLPGLSLPTCRASACGGLYAVFGDTPDMQTLSALLDKHLPEEFQLRIRETVHGAIEAFLNHVRGAGHGGVALDNILVNVRNRSIYLGPFRTIRGETNLTSDFKDLEALMCDLSHHINGRYQNICMFLEFEEAIYCSHCKSRCNQAVRCSANHSICSPCASRFAKSITAIGAIEVHHVCSSQARRIKVEAKPPHVFAKTRHGDVYVGPDDSGAQLKCPCCAGGGTLDPKALLGLLGEEEQAAFSKLLAKVERTRLSTVSDVLTVWRF